MDEFESLFSDDRSKVRQAVIDNVNVLMDTWPDIVAMWSGMVEQAKEAGWHEYAARALVLSQILPDSSYIIAVAADTHKSNEEE